MAITKLTNTVKPLDEVDKINELVDGVNGSQPTLVSGTNIKTINNNSILGSGNITIQSTPSIDSKSITTNSSSELQTVGVIDQNNTSNAIKTWTGTKAQYNALVSGGTVDSGTLYNIVDDSDVTTSILDALYPVGSLYIGSSSLNACPLAVLGVGTWTLKSNNAIVTDVNSVAPCKGNGIALGLTDGTNNYGAITLINAGYNAIVPFGSEFGSNVSVGGSAPTASTRPSDYSRTGITTDSTKSGIEAIVTSTSLSVNIWERTA